MTDTSEGGSPDKPDSEPVYPRPVVLLLLDGWGVAPAGESNALSLARTPNLTKLIKEYPVATLESAFGDWNRRYLTLGAGRPAAGTDEAPVASLSALVAQAGKRQVKITDADRFAALTYFFNGLSEDRRPQDDWQIITTDPGQDDKITANFQAVLKAGVRAIEASDPADLIVISLPYLDVVSLAAAAKLTVVIKAIESLDKGVRSLVQATISQKGVLLLSAAGGNAEQLLNMRTEALDPGLTENPVPFIVVGDEYKGLAISGQDAPDYDLSILEPAGTLADIAPTILALLGLEQPSEMTGRNLLSA